MSLLLLNFPMTPKWMCPTWKCISWSLHGKQMCTVYYKNPLIKWFSLIWSKLLFPLASYRRRVICLIKWIFEILFFPDSTIKSIKFIISKSPNISRWITDETVQNEIQDMLNISIWCQWIFFIINPMWMLFFSFIINAMCSTKILCWIWIFN